MKSTHFVVKASVQALCTEKVRLVEEYHTATKSYCLAVSEWHEKIGTSARPVYLALRDVVERASEAASEARHRLERHIEKHMCCSGPYLVQF